jgi:hypothetical protein
MAFSTSSAISLEDLRNKLGGTGTVSLADYYQNSSTNYCKLIEGIPLSGTEISLNTFRGKSPTLVYNATGGNQTLTIPSTCSMIFVKAWGQVVEDKMLLGDLVDFHQGIYLLTLMK